MFFKEDIAFYSERLPELDWQDFGEINKGSDGSFFLDGVEADVSMEEVVVDFEEIQSEGTQESEYEIEGIEEISEQSDSDCHRL